MTQNDDPITAWLAAAADGDAEAQGKIWDKFESEIREVAGDCLGAISRSDSDEEDIIVRVMKSLFMRLEDGRLRRPAHRGELHNLLFSMTKKKSAEVVRAKTAKKRQLPRVGDTSQLDELDQHSSNESSPFDLIAEAEAITKLVAALPTDVLKQTAMLRITGATHAEIAQELGCTERTIELRMKRIREIARQLGLPEA